MFKKISFSINMKLLPMKAHYFLFNLATGPIVANLSIIARQRGFSSAVVGILLTIFYFVATICKPVFGWLADRFKKHKLIFIVMQGITALMFLSVYFIPRFTNQVIVNSEPTNTEIYFCPKESVWDKCLDFRIQEHKTKIVKCQLNCKFQAWMKDKICSNSDKVLCTSDLEDFKYEITIDMTTIEKDTNCLILKEYKNASNLNNYTSFYAMAPIFAKMHEINCDAICEDDFLKGAMANKGILPDDEIVKYYEFWLFSGLLLIGYSANSVVISMADTFCFNLLGDESYYYGRQRMWDGLGWGVAALIFGPIIDEISGDAVFKDYSIVYFFCFITICINMICSVKLEYDQPTKSQNILKDVGKLFKSAKIFTFFCWCCFAGFFSAVVWNFIFWHIEELTEKRGQDDCGVNYVKTLEGLDLVVQCLIGETPFFFWSGFILKKVGYVNSMNLVLGAFATRYFYYSVLSNPWWVLPIELLTGITYALMYCTMTSYINYIAPPGTEATLQGLAGALFEGIGLAFGNFATGTLFNVVGASSAFVIFGITATIATIIHVVVNIFLKFFEKKSKNSSKNVVKP